jgi:hypothetical protein
MIIGTMSNFPIDVCSVPPEHKAIIWGVFARHGHYEDDADHPFFKGVIYLTPSTLCGSGSLP